MVDGWLKEWTEFASETNEAPPDFHLAVGVCLLSAFLGGYHGIRIFTGRVPRPTTPRITTFIIGDSGCGKGVAINNWGRGLLSRIKKCGKVIPQIWDDGSARGLMDWLADNRWGLMGAEEGATFLGQNQDYQKGMLPTLARAFDDSESYELHFVKRREQNQSAIIEDPRLVGLFGSTPAWLESIITGKAATGGFTGRALWWIGRRERIVIPREVKENEWKDVVEGFVKVASLEGDIHLAMSADKGARVASGRDYFWDWYRAYRKQLDESPPLARLKSWVVRKEWWLAKLSAIVAASRGELDISPKDIDIALVLLGRIEKGLKNMLLLLGTEGLTESQEIVYRKLRDVGGCFLKKQLFNLPLVAPRFRDYREFETTIQTLKERGLVNIDTSPNGEQRIWAKF